MANNSLYAAFAQFWIHVQELVDSKIGSGGTGSTTANFNINTSAGDSWTGDITSGTMDISGADGIYVRVLDGYGEVSGSGSDLQIGLDTGKSLVPKVTTADNGKFLQVVNGAWVAVTIPTAEGVKFGE